MKYKRLTDRKIAEMLINTEGNSWDSDNIEAQCYIRLAELEDKIEDGELIERTSEECSAVRKQAVREFAEEFKSRYFFMMTTYMKDPIYQCTGDELDRLVKEVCGDDPS